MVPPRGPSDTLIFGSHRGRVSDFAASRLDRLPGGLDGGRMSGASRTADKIFAALAAITALAVLVQVFLAGVGVFGMDAAKAEDAGSFDPHRVLGEIIGGLTLLMLIAALVARASRRGMLGHHPVFLPPGVAPHRVPAGWNTNKW